LDRFWTAKPSLQATVLQPRRPIFKRLEPINLV